MLLTRQETTRMANLDRNALMERFNQLTTNELRELLADSIKRLNQEQHIREDLQKRNNELINQHDELISQHDELVAQHDELIRENNELLDEIENKDKLISDYSIKREELKAQANKLMREVKLRANSIEKEAKRRADAITSEAVKQRTQAEKKIREADAQVANKLANANAEADSIIETKLIEAEDEIRALEAKRAQAKKRALTFNKSVVNQYDGIIRGVSGTINDIEKMKRQLVQSSREIERENFKRFEIDDYVSTVGHARSSSSLDDYGLSTTKRKRKSKTSYLDYDEDDSLYDLSDDDLSFLNDDEDDDMDADYEPMRMSDGKKALSFTDSFMAVKPKPASSSASASRSSVSSIDDDFSNALSDYDNLGMEIDDDLSDLSDLDDILSVPSAPAATSSRPRQSRSAMHAAQQNRTTGTATTSAPRRRASRSRGPEAWI